MRYITNPDVFYKNIKGKVIILKGHTNFVRELNETASIIWILLQKTHDKHQIYKKIVNMYNVDEKTAQNDVDSFIRLYLKEGLLQEVK